MGSDITTLPPFDKTEGAWRVVVETPRGSRAKYSYEPDLGVYQLAHILPEGTEFPYAFGFLPSTRGEDGDPLDVLLLIEEETFCGTVVLSNIVGVIEGVQKEKGKKSVRNDRYLGVPIASRQFADITSAKALPAQLVEDIAQFFEHYNRVLGRDFEVITWKGPAAARKLIRENIRATKKLAKHA